MTLMKTKIQTSSSTTSRTDRIKSKIIMKKKTKMMMAMKMISNKKLHDKNLQITRKTIKKWKLFCSSNNPQMMAKMMNRTSKIKKKKS